MQPEKVKFELRLGQSKPLYNAFKAIQESPEWPKLSEARKRIVDSEFLNFVIFVALSELRAKNILIFKFKLKV